MHRPNLVACVGTSLDATLLFRFFSRKEKRMDNRFDDLTKALAEGIPRRQALRRLAGLFGGALLGCLAFGGAARANSCGPHEFKCSAGTCCSKDLYNCCTGGG